MLERMLEGREEKRENVENVGEMMMMFITYRPEAKARRRDRENSV